MSSIRYTLLTLVFILSSFNVYSQDISVHPWVGVGITDLEGNPLDQSVFGRDMGWAGGAKLELSGNRWQKSIGICMLRTGFGTEVSAFDLNGVAKWYQFKGRIHHILIPVSLGYKIPVGKMSLMPELGIAAGYLANAVYKIKDIESGSTEQGELKLAGNAEFRKFSMFGIMGINMVYPVNKRFALTVAPTYYLMVSNSNSRTGGFFNYGAAGHQYTLTLNVGLKMNLW